MTPRSASAIQPGSRPLSLLLVALFLLLPASRPHLHQKADLAARLAALKMPDSQVVYSPAALGFNMDAYLVQSGGYLGQYREYLGTTGWTSSAEIIGRVALENSTNPRLLLALLEYTCQCVLGQTDQGLLSGYSLGVKDFRRKGLYGQLWWASNQLSAGYYGWREGWLTQITLPDGSVYTPDPASNPGSVALQYYFVQLSLAHTPVKPAGPEQEDEWTQLFDPETGFQAVFWRMFGDPYELARGFEPNLPGGLGQPELILPFEPNALWSLTSGPHRAWEVIGSLAALDFAPAASQTGCVETTAWVVAMADGMVVRSGNGLVVMDLDDSMERGKTIYGRSDGLEQTGWAILYVHLGEKDRAPVGVHLRRGARLGHPSCEGGPATGVNLHVARKYNGEWIAAGGQLPFIMSGWTAHAGAQPYQGWLSRDDEAVSANIYAMRSSYISRTLENHRRWLPQE